MHLVRWPDKRPVRVFVLPDRNDLHVAFCLTAEYAGEPLQWRDFGVFPPDRSIRTEVYSVQGTWRPQPPVELMLRY